MMMDKASNSPTIKRSTQTSEVKGKYPGVEPIESEDQPRPTPRMGPEEKECRLNRGTQQNHERVLTLWTNIGKKPRATIQMSTNLEGGLPILGNS